MEEYKHICECNKKFNNSRLFFTHKDNCEIVKLKHIKQEEEAKKKDIEDIIKKDEEKMNLESIIERGVRSIVFDKKLEIMEMEFKRVVDGQSDCIEVLQKEMLELQLMNKLIMKKINHPDKNWNMKEELIKEYHKGDIMVEIKNKI